jgi:hypothetical protein
MSFESLLEMKTQPKFERGRDVAEDRQIHQYLSDCKDAVAHVMRSSNGMHGLEVKRQGGSGSFDQTF